MEDRFVTIVYIARLSSISSRVPNSDNIPMRAKLTQGSVGLHLIKLTLPMIWGIFAIIAFSLADTYFVAQLGTQPLAAMSFTFPVVMALGNVAMGLGTGAASVIARALGEGNRHRVQRLTTDSLILALIVVGVFALVGLLTIDPLFSALGAGPDILPLVRDYMQIWYLGITFLVVPMVGTSAIRALGNTAVPSLIMTVAAVVNVGLDPLFIFGWGSLPGMGLRGAAIATVISRATTLIATLAFLHYRERILLFTVPKLNAICQNWKRILHVGLPAAITNLITPLSIGLITNLLAHYGPEAVAGLGIASRIEAFGLIVPMSVAASMGPFAGQNWGAQQSSRVRQALRLCMFFCLGWGVLLAIGLGANAVTIAAAFDPDPQVVATAAQYLTWVPASYGAVGVVLTLSFTFNAIGKPLPSMAITSLRTLLLYVPVAYLGSLLFGIPGIFAAACLTNFGVALGAFLWVRYAHIFTLVTNSTSGSDTLDDDEASQSIAVTNP